MLFLTFDSFAARFSLKCESQFRSLLMCFLTFDSFAARFSLKNENQFRYLMFFLKASFWEVPWSPKPARSAQGLIVFASGSIFDPPSLRFIDFWLPFLTVFCRSLNGEQPQRTIKSCRKPSEISTATLHCHHFAFCRTPAAATNACTKPPSYKMGGRRCSRRMAHSDYIQLFVCFICIYIYTYIKLCF